MTKYYYKQSHKKSIKLAGRIVGILLAIGALGVVLYIFTPLLVWNLFFAKAFADNQIVAPIPQYTLVSPATIKSLLAAGMNSIRGVDYTNAENWFPGFVPTKSTQPKVSTYLLSIPKLQITNAFVSTVDNDLASHLVNFEGTAIPPEKGNAVIFGHSTLPQLFNPTNYKTILANAYKLQVGDTLIATVENVGYTYRIYSITVVNPDDTRALIQQYDDRYLTLITCTPPGTIWQRLIIKARLETL